MEDYKKKYELLHLATVKAIEALQNALMDIENMNISAEDELIPGNIGAYAEEKERNAPGV